MMKHILLAYDGSQASLKAFDTAADLARRYGAQLHVLTVAPTPEIADDVETQAIIEQGRRRHQGLLDHLQNKAHHLGIAIQPQLLVGHPAQQIIDHALQLQTDLIVIGHRGHGALDLWKIGSVTHRVISYAQGAVLVVR